MDQEENATHFLQRWFSIGDLLSMMATLVALGVVYGAISKDVETLREDVGELKQQRITPGAAIEIATMRAIDANQDRQIIELRDELRSSRREILDSLARVEGRLEAHDKR